MQYAGQAGSKQHRCVLDGAAAAAASCITTCCLAAWQDCMLRLPCIWNSVCQQLGFVREDGRVC